MRALRACGARVEVADWDDPDVRWSSYDLAVLRSTWDYTERPSEFLAWADRVAATTPLSNSAAVVRWNTDKHYLSELARAGVPIVPSRFIEPGEDPTAALGLFLSEFGESELVVKPAIGAGSRDTRRYKRSARDAAATHAGQLLAAGRSVLLQPYLDRVDEQGETALIFFAGASGHAMYFDPSTGVKSDARGGAIGNNARCFDPSTGVKSDARGGAIGNNARCFDPSTGVKPDARGGAATRNALCFDHAIRKGPMLPMPWDEASGPSVVGDSSLFVAERILPRTPAADELAVAERALAAVPFHDLLYARVDLIRDSAGAPVLLELELTEPSLFFAPAPGSAERFAQAVLDHARSFTL